MHQEGFIAYFDILGFSDLIKEEDFSDKIEKYNEILTEAIHVDAWDLEYVFFSDSVIINSKSNDESELLQLIIAISEISHRLLTELHLAICGCISFGKFTKLMDDEKNVILTGIPILDAIHYEQAQNWIGIMISPRVIKFYPNLNEKKLYTNPNSDEVKNMIDNILWLPCVYRYDKIPFSENKYYDGFIITPKDADVENIDDVKNNLLEYHDKLDELRLYAPDSYSQHKFSNTMGMIVEFYNQWRIIPKTDRTKSLHEINYIDLWAEFQEKNK